MLTRNTVTSHGRGRIKKGERKKKERAAVLRRTARKGNSRAGALSRGKTRRLPMYEMHRARCTGRRRLAGRDAILCIKQKAAQIRYPASFVLTFRAYFKRVARSERPYRDSPADCSLYVRARYFYYYSRVCCTRRAATHITVVKGLHFRFGGRRKILSNSKWRSDYDKTK